jgi:hypothetical protein
MVLPHDSLQFVGRITHVSEHCAKGLASQLGDLTEFQRAVLPKQENAPLFFGEFCDCVLQQPSQLTRHKLTGWIRVPRDLGNFDLVRRAMLASKMVYRDVMRDREEPGSKSLPIIVRLEALPNSDQRLLE